MTGDVIYSNGQMIRYDLDGAVIARARHTDAGWVITSPDYPDLASEPIPDKEQARIALARWDPQTAYRLAVQAAAGRYRQARQDLEAAVRAASDGGVPQTRIAEDAGFSRQWIRQMLRPPPAHT